MNEIKHDVTMCVQKMTNNLVLRILPILRRCGGGTEHCRNVDKMNGGSEGVPLTRHKMRTEGILCRKEVFGKHAFLRKRSPTRVLQYP